MNLHADFGKLHFVCDGLSCVDIRIVTLFERLLQLIELIRRERRPVAALLLFRLKIVRLEVSYVVDLMTTVKT